MLFAVDFSGYMLSPMHKCVAIGKMYFGTKLSHYVKILGVWALLCNYIIRRYYYMLDIKEITMEHHKNA